MIELQERKMKLIQEGKAVILAPDAKKVSKKMEVFYNPAMQTNRDITVLILNAIPDKQLRIADPLAGTGIRAIRLCKELETEKIDHVFINDHNEDAVKIIQENLQNNKLTHYDTDNETFFQTRNNQEHEKHHVHIYNQDANMFLLKSTGFDYIDIDPFGTPNPFLDAAIQRISRNGILGITATDTAALAGTYRDVCQRKYWAMPELSALKHEIGLRILIRKVQLVGMQYEKALTPIYAYSHQHYMRVFFRAQKSKEECNILLKNHQMLGKAGPLWTGTLWDENLAKKICDTAQNNPDCCGETRKLAKTIAEESFIRQLGFFDVHAIAKELHLTSIPSSEHIFEKIKEKKYQLARTHFANTGIRTTMPEKEFMRVLKKLSEKMK